MFEHLSGGTKKIFKIFIYKRMCGVCICSYSRHKADILYIISKYRRCENIDILETICNPLAFGTIAPLNQ